jgi:hypothetical protein
MNYQCPHCGQTFSSDAPSGTLVCCCFCQKNVTLVPPAANTAPVGHYHVVVEADYLVLVHVWIDDKYLGFLQSNAGDGGRDFVLKGFPPGQHTVKVKRGKWFPKTVTKTFVLTDHNVLFRATGSAFANNLLGLYLEGPYFER